MTFTDPPYHERLKLKAQQSLSRLYSTRCRYYVDALAAGLSSAPSPPSPSFSPFCQVRALHSIIIQSYLSSRRSVQATSTKVPQHSFEPQPDELLLHHRRVSGNRDRNERAPTVPFPGCQNSSMGIQHAADSLPGSSYTCYTLL